jgi:hypothetical protein
LKKLCNKNVLPTVGEGEEVNCRVLPLCHDSPGLAAGTECYKPGSSLA